MRTSDISPRSLDPRREGRMLAGRAEDHSSSILYLSAVRPSSLRENPSRVVYKYS
jgi:hypothetical protein